MRWQLSTSQAIIFSHSTCLPASRQATETSAWAHSGVATSTASMSSFSSICLRSWYSVGRFAPALLQALGRRLGVQRVDVADRPDVDPLLLALAQQHLALAAGAHQGGLDRSALLGTLDRGGARQGGQCRSARQRLEEVATADLFLLVGQVHGRSFSFPGGRVLRAREGGRRVPAESCARPQGSKRSRPAIRPVSNDIRAKTASASISVLLTMR